MKKSFRSKTQTAPLSEPPKSPLSAEEYARLSPDEQSAYRPVDPKYERLPVVCWILFGLAAANFSKA